MLSPLDHIINRLESVKQMQAPSVGPLLCYDYEDKLALFKAPTLLETICNGKVESCQHGLVVPLW